MKHIYIAKEWQSSSGIWRVADTTDLVNNSAVWWIPPFVFDLSYEDYITMLVEKYHVTQLSFDKILIFGWDEYKNAHQYMLDINRIAKKKQFMI